MAQGNFTAGVVIGCFFCAACCASYLSLPVAEHFQNVPREVLLDLAVSRHWLRHLGRGILIPVVPPAVADEDAAESLDFLDEIPVLHATSSSA